MTLYQIRSILNNYRTKMREFQSEADKEAARLEKFKDSVKYGESLKKIEAERMEKVRSLQADSKEKAAKLFEDIDANIRGREFEFPTEKETKIIELLKMKKSLSAVELSQVRGMISTPFIADCYNELCTENKQEQLKLHHIDQEDALRFARDLKTLVLDSLSLDKVDNRTGYLSEAREQYNPNLPLTIQQHSDSSFDAVHRFRIDRDYDTSMELVEAVAGSDAEEFSRFADGTY